MASWLLLMQAAMVSAARAGAAQVGRERGAGSATGRASCTAPQRTLDLVGDARVGALEVPAARGQWRGERQADAPAGRPDSSRPSHIATHESRPWRTPTASTMSASPSVARLYSMAQHHEGSVTGQAEGRWWECWRRPTACAATMQGTAACALHGHSCTPLTLIQATEELLLLRLCRKAGQMQAGVRIRWAGCACTRRRRSPLLPSLAPLTAAAATPTHRCHTTGRT